VDIGVCPDTRFDNKDTQVYLMAFSGLKQHFRSNVFAMCHGGHSVEQEMTGINTILHPGLDRDGHTCRELWLNCLCDILLKSGSQRTEICWLDLRLSLGAIQRTHRDGVTRSRVNRLSQHYSHRGAHNGIDPSGPQRRHQARCQGQQQNHRGDKAKCHDVSRAYYI